MESDLQYAWQGMGRQMGVDGLGSKSQKRRYDPGLRRPDGIDFDLTAWCELFGNTVDAEDFKEQG